MIVNDRLADVESYNILDTLPDHELDEFTQLASVICGSPISLITILDDTRQWFKSAKGTSLKETPIDESFCQYSLNKPEEVLIVNDALKDDRFKTNRLVTGNPNIRFYAGAPLVTSKNNVLGTLCVIDTEPKELTAEQQDALMILSKKAMEAIESKKLVSQQSSTISLNTRRLLKITENVPSVIFEMTIVDNEINRFEFVSKGILKFYPDIDPEQLIRDPNGVLAEIMQFEFQRLKTAILDSWLKKEPFLIDYMIMGNTEPLWHSISGYVEKRKPGEYTVYGSISDVTKHYKYKNDIDQIIFDMSHILREPVDAVVNLMQQVENEPSLNNNDLHKNMRLRVNELDECSLSLIRQYEEKKANIYKW